MDTQRWTTLSALLDELLELPEEPRAQRLAQIQAADPGLGEELGRMLALEDESPDFLAQPVVDAALFAPQPGQSIGPYKLERPLGEGGMGQVWLALRADGLYHRRVALKLLRPGLGDAGLRTRFTRERQILARLGHAHIARLLDAGVSQDGQPYLALDYVQGEPITTYVQQLSLDLPARVQLFLQVCAAVSHAHANLVVHRDLKPSNILVTSAGEVCLLDFGIAKLLDEPDGPAGELTGTGARAFTLHYAAPEQLRSEPVTTMTDVYALGVVLYEMLCGRKPYDPARPTDAAWEEAILGADPVLPSTAALRVAREQGHPRPRRLAQALAGDLDNILLKALAKDPEQRYVSVEALAQDLRRHLDGEPVLARRQGLGYTLAKFVSRHRVALATGAAVTVLLLSALASVSWQARRALDEARRAQAMRDFVVALFEDTDQAGDGGLDVRTLLDAGVRRADTELAAQPMARAELLGLVARLRSGLGDDRATLALLDRQAQVLATLGKDAPERIGLEAAGLRGRSLRALGQPDLCVRSLVPWLGVAERLRQAEPGITADFLSQLGRCHRSLGGREVARDLFGRALALRRELPGGLARQAESQADLAGLLADEGRSAEAVHALQQALTLLRTGGGDRNALGVEIWRDLGGMHWASGDYVEGEASYRQAMEIALARFGVGHPVTAAVQRPLGAILIETGKLGEAERLLRPAHAQLLERFGPEHPEVALSWHQQARLAWEQGRLPASAEALRTAIALWRRGNELVQQPTGLCDLGQVELAMARPAQALSPLQECRTLALSGGEVALAARAERLLAEAALAQGDLDGARRGLDAAQAQLDAAASQAPPIGQDQIDLDRVRVSLREGDLGGAQAALEALQQRPRELTPRDQRFASWMQAVGAEILCRRGRLAEGRAQRDALLEALQAEQPERQRLFDEVAQLAGGCGPG